MPPSARPPSMQGNGHLPEMSVFRGLGAGSTQPGGQFAPLPQVSPPSGNRGRTTTLLPQVQPPPRKSSIPGAPPSLGDSITRVRGPNTIPEPTPDPADFAMTTPEGQRGAQPNVPRVQAEPLDWDDEEESTHVFDSSRPPPPSAASQQPLRLPNSRPFPAAPPSSGPRLVRPSLLSQGGVFRASAPPMRASAPPQAAQAPMAQAPTTDTMRLDAMPGYANGANGHAPHAAQPAFPPPPPPIPSITQAKPIHIEPVRPIDEQAEVVRDQPFVRLPTGNPHTATELALKRPTLPQPGSVPAYLAPPQTDSKKWLLGAAGAAALLSIGALIAFIVMRRPGGIEVEVKDATGASVPRAEVFLDGRKVCEATPCFVSNVEVGRHSVRVLAPNDPDREPMLAEVKAGEVSKLTVTLEPSLGTLVVPEGQAGLRLWVDGTDRGPLPAKLTDLSPGEHDLKIAGERYKAWEKRIDIRAGETIDLELPKLTVVKGRVLVTLKTEGANITLVRADEPNKPRALEGPFPRPVEVPIESGSWKLVAKKKGMPDFVAPLDFSDGVAEKTIVVELGKEAEPEPISLSSIPSPSPGPGPAPPSRPEPARPDPPTAPDPTASDPPASGTGFLNINSIPASRVLLDGKPLGETPKTGVQVSAGTHTVTFIHPEHGKKSVSVKVGPGETKTASARLKSD